MFELIWLKLGRDIPKSPGHGFKKWKLWLFQYKQVDKRFLVLC
jgi:hypothetical protein